MSMPKVSIIIPVYNTEKYLKQCIESLTNQTLSEIEIIVPYREENMLAVLFRKGDEIYTYISKGLIENVSEAESLLFVSDYIIFGGYGKAYSKVLNIDEFDKRLNTVVSFDERVNIDTSYSSWQPPKLYFVDYKFYFYK